MPFEREGPLISLNVSLIVGANIDVATTQDGSEPDTTQNKVKGWVIIS